VFSLTNIKCRRSSRQSHNSFSAGKRARHLPVRWLAAVVVDVFDGEALLVFVGRGVRAFGLVGVGVADV
jgi:hypothetical protein